MGNRSGKREEKKETPRDTPAYHMLKLHGMVAVEQNDCWAEWMVKDSLAWPEGGTFDRLVVQNLWEELLRRHRPVFLKVGRGNILVGHDDSELMNQYMINTL